MRIVQNPGPMLLALGVLVALLALLVVKATWTPVAPFRVGRRRRWGQLLAASARMYATRPRLFIGLGLLLIPVTILITLIQWLLGLAIDLVGVLTGSGAGLFAYFALVVGTTLTLLAFALVQAATACALVELDAGRPVDAAGAYRLALRRSGPLLRAVGIFVLVWVGLTTTTVLLPVAIWLAVRWSLLAPAVELEQLSGVGALRRSAELVRGRWLRVGSLVGLGGLVALAAGPLVGALLIFVSNSSLALLNLVAGVVYAIALPFVAIVTAYVYVDARSRREREPRAAVDELPAQSVLDPS
jgi:hypothetical protein